jgi:hypothetical protein
MYSKLSFQNTHSSFFFFYNARLLNGEIDISELALLLQCAHLKLPLLSFSPQLTLPLRAWLFNQLYLLVYSGLSVADHVLELLNILLVLLSQSLSLLSLLVQPLTTDQLVRVLVRWYLLVLMDLKEVTLLGIQNRRERLLLHDNVPCLRLVRRNMQVAITYFKWYLSTKSACALWYWHFRQ